MAFCSLQIEMSIANRDGRYTAVPVVIKGIQANSHELEAPVVILCYAKINLTLEILGKRADGYHEVRTVMQTVGLADRLEVTAAADLSFTCSDPALGNAGQSRLPRRTTAASGVRRAHRCRAQAGKAHSCGCWHGGRQQRRGSDYCRPQPAVESSAIPYWNSGGWRRRWAQTCPSFSPAARHWPRAGASALRRCRRCRLRWVVLRAAAPCALSTAAVYQAVTPADYTSGVTTADTVAAAKHGTISPQTRWHNALERPARALATEITSAQTALLKAGAERAHVSGSGPTVFAVCREEGAARTLADRLQEQRTHRRDRPARSVRLGLGRSGRVEPGASGAKGYAWWYECCVDKDSPASVFRLPP